jgi:ABC-2 type transport system ATP-binding protein
MNSVSLPVSGFATSGRTDARRAPPIVCQGLRKQFGRNEVLCGVDLTIPAGAVVGLVGTNGAGKSTLIKCLLGLLRPTAGQATILGEDPWSLSTAAKGRLGYVPQTVQLYPWMTVEQIVDYTAAFYDRWDRAWADTLLDRLDLPRDQRVGPLSVGQQQKLALVLALGHRPELLILDEPVASLDPVARRELLRSLMEMTLDHQHTQFFSTHITSDLERVASHIALLREGRIVLFDELDALKDRVKRLRFKSTQPLPKVPQIRGALRVQVDGDRALVSVAEFSDELLAELRERFQAEISVENLNLEDIFLELHHE